MVPGFFLRSCKSKFLLFLAGLPTFSVAKPIYVFYGQNFPFPRKF
ncbi:hypothetical protein LEP1GSC060_0793 [Leptospira weilii serovar Ranarum str. ICFT]|uniref:Uncharacterized protein n=1 Tax=Leptospira weilii serovar Ranarum str. ICFT TaxID=1218598 RepID=N1WT21_9LEPT|nr:hypothetical protein LEP1GSC060_0793 [Leptospira weilii serovar Ranarum str. ICFT]